MFAIVDIFILVLLFIRRDMLKIRKKLVMKYWIQHKSQKISMLRYLYNKSYVNHIIIRVCVFAKMTCYVLYCDAFKINLNFNLNLSYI